MKSSLRTLLILSLASMAIIGTGCERRGRAPTKAAPAEGNNTTQTLKPGEVAQKPGEPSIERTPTPTNSGTPAPTSSATTYSQEEKDLIALAALPASGECQISINPSEAPSAESFVRDFVSIQKFYRCMGANGVLLAGGNDLDPSGLRQWTVDTKALRVRFEDIAEKTGENDDKIAAMFEARMDIYTLYGDRMLTKYAADKISPETKFTAVGGKSFTIRGSLSEIQLQISALAVAKGELKEFISVKDGAKVESESSTADST